MTNIQNYNGFVYLWYDRKRQMFYLGSHHGSIDDGYTGSGRRFLYAYKKRPDDFRRRIVEFVTGNKFDTLQMEQKWLNMIDESELNVRYYNQKKFASGGSVKGRKQPKSEEHKLKLRKPRINKSKMSYPKSSSHKRNISIALAGKKKGYSSMLGKTHTIESKLLISMSAQDRSRICCVFCREELLVCHLAQYHRKDACGARDTTKNRKSMPKYSEESKLNVSVGKMTFRLRTPMGLFLSYKDFEISTGIPSQSIKNIFINLNRKPTPAKLDLFGLESRPGLTWAGLGFERALLDE